MITQFSKIDNQQFYQMQKSSMRQLMNDTAHFEKVVQWSVKSDRKTFAGMYCDFSNTDLRQKISQIKCPSLILLESYFANQKPSIEEQYKNMPMARLQYAKKGLHFIMYDDKNWFDHQLNDFINKSR
jgi:hypothetical protein